MQERINLRKKRTVPEMVSEIFNYLKIHILNLFKALIIIVGPFYIVGSIFIGQFYGNIFSMAESAVEPDLSSFISIFPAMILLLIGGILFQAVIVTYMHLSQKLNKEEITFQLVFSEVRELFWRYLGANLLFALGFTVIMIVLAVVVAMVPVIGIFAMMFGIFYIMIAFSIFPFAIGVEKLSAVNSIGRSFELIKGNWWRTFGFYILTSIIQSFMASIIMIPIYIMAFFNMFSSAFTDGTPPDMNQMGTIMTIIMPIAMFINLFFYSFTGVGMGINYYSLVEQKEEIGLKEQIEAMNPENNESESI